MVEMELQLHVFLIILLKSLKPIAAASNPADSGQFDAGAIEWDGVLGLSNLVYFFLRDKEKFGI